MSQELRDIILRNSFKALTFSLVVNQGHRERRLRAQNLIEIYSSQRRYEETRNETVLIGNRVTAIAFSVGGSK